MPKSDSITIKDFFSVDELKNSKVLAGESGILQMISKINVAADYDIFDWVQEDEFLLMTGYFFAFDDAMTQLEFIQQCISSGLSGLGIKMRPYLSNLNTNALELAEQHNFPIIEISSQLPLSNIINIFTNNLLHKRTALLERIEGLNRKLHQAMMSSGKIEDVLNIVEEQIRNPIGMHILFNNTDYFKFNYIDDFSSQSIKEDYKTFLNHYNPYSNDNSLVKSKIIIENKLLARFMIPIINKSNVAGHLFSWSTHSPLQEFDAVVIEHASTFISLILQQELSKQEVELKHRSRYIDDLTSKDHELRKRAFQKAYLYKMEEDDHYISVILNFNDRNGSDESSKQDSSFIYQTILRIEEFLEKYLLNGLIASENNSIRIIINSADPDNLMARVKALSNELLLALQQKFSQYSFQIGIGKIVTGINNYKISYDSSYDAINIGSQIMNDPIITYEELGIYTILANDAVRSQVDEIYSHHIKPLIEYDQNKKSELFNTLLSYFNNNSNVSKVSEEMFIHYNTALYRLDRIQKITDLDINNPDDKFLLEVAIKIARLQT